MAGLYMPLSTLQGWPHGQPHMTQGRYGSLRLYRMTLSFTTTCRFSPALSGEMTMKFMLILKSSKDSEAGKMPSEESIAAMVQYNQEQAKAGILVDAAGLFPPSQSGRGPFSAGWEQNEADRPLTQTQEMVGGSWIIRV